MRTIRITAYGSGKYYVDPAAGGSGGNVRITSQGVQFLFDVAPDAKNAVAQSIYDSFRNNDPEQDWDIIIRSF